MSAPAHDFRRSDVREFLASLPAKSCHCVVTSPPYWALRDYGFPEQIGLEGTLAEHLATMREAFREVRRVLHPSGVLWLNYGDAWAQTGAKPTQDESQRKRYETEYRKNEARANVRHYATGAYSCTEFRRAEGTAQGSGLPHKSLLMLPARVALALQDDEWLLRAEVIWHKPNGKPEPPRGRPTKGHETVYLFAKGPRYFYNVEAVRGPSGAALRTVWTINNQATHDGHTATFPEELARRCILLGSSGGGCCEACLEPRLPTYAGEPDLEWQRKCGGDVNGRYEGAALKDYAGQGAETPGDVKARILRGLGRKTLTGYEPGCQCGAPTVPCTVLDPFAGTATTLVVALRHGRSALGCELSAEYHAIGAERLEAEVSGVPVREARAGQGSLWGNKTEGMVAK